VALLSDIPAIPEHFELLRLWQRFLDQRKVMPFLNNVPIPSRSEDSITPHLLLSAAPFALLMEGDQQRARDTFVAAVSVWSALIEIDNRESRTEDSLIAVHPLPSPTQSKLCAYRRRVRCCPCTARSTRIQQQDGGVERLTMLYQRCQYTTS
jgi:hypothetical protein